MIPRSQILEESLLDYVEQRLRAAGYEAGEFEILEAFPHDKIRGDSDIDKTYIAVGFNFTDVAKRVEMGSTLSRRPCTFEIFVFAPGDSNAGENVTGVLVQVLDRQLLPIIDVEDPARTVVDQLELEGVSSQRQPIPRPRPWEENVHLVTLRATDEYYAEA